ncbi:unnamed protein product, partial [Mesorhabditis belari]|uniref:Uncharacterized protein n=1 Tax=Mesorhabditis belari TaxID=2138241 RepID=A0AAF3FF11_9BILA
MDELCKEADTTRKSKLGKTPKTLVNGPNGMLCENQDGASVLKALECSQNANTKNNIADKCGDVNFGSCSELVTARTCLIRELKTLCGNDRATSFLNSAYINNDDRRGTPIFDCRVVIAKVVGLKAW